MRDHPLLSGFNRGMESHFCGDPIDYLEENMVIPFSARSTSFDRTLAPHLSDIIRASTDTYFQKVIVRACTGFGKTTLLECVSTIAVGVEPGPMLIVGQTDKDIGDWAESRWQRIVEATPILRSKLPQNRHKAKNMEILWPHMDQFMTGPNLSGLQSKSMRYCYGDETWIWKKGMIGELKARHHDRWNRKTILVTQGWETQQDAKHDMDEEYGEGDDNRRGFTCPSCKEWQEFTWEHIKYEEITGKSGRTDYDSTGRTARCQCGVCKAEFPDTPASRRKLSDAGSYKPHNPDRIAKVTSYTCPAWAVWWIPWSELVIEWVKAQKAKHRGDTDPLRKFTMKRAAGVWEVKTSRVTEEDVNSMRNPNVRLKECPIDPCMVTISGDVGELRTHWSVQAWLPSGESFVIDHGTALAPEDLINLTHSLEYPIKGTEKTCKVTCGLVDSGDFTERIYSVCARSGGKLFPSKGSGAQSGQHWATSELKDDAIPLLYTYSDYHAKVALYLERIGKKTSPRLHFATDVSEEFLMGHQGQRLIDSEDRKSKVFKKIPWDHYGDCSKLHVVAWWVLKGNFES